MAEMTEMLLVLLYTLHASAICGNQDTKSIETSEEGLVGEKEFPWIVSLQDSHYTHLTFGSILSQFWILSIASAFQNRKDAIAIVGIAKMDGRVIAHEEYPIDKIVIHEDFDNKTMANNIALLKTDTAMHFSNLVGSICFLGRKLRLSSALRNCWVAGWNPTTATGHHMTMSILRKISVKNIDMCPLHNYEKTGCGYHVEKETDAVCLGDPGNPMMCQLQHLNLWVLRGILSKGGERCPGLFLYIKVEDYSAWITSKTKRTGLPLSVLHHWEHSIPFFSNSSNASATRAKNSELGGAIWPQNYFQRLRGDARDAEARRAPRPRRAPQARRAARLTRAAWSTRPTRPTRLTWPTGPTWST
uniref:Inactive serine protease 54 n=1 Tax=Rousettus aegyptiacus TaxID=9407 RepID=A0A7J8CKT3_ROUAE|nr:serine protease 54 [Rousettus aegyptiacus]